MIRNRTKRFKVYEANRISEILARSDPHHDWRYVPTDCNPADCASRPLLSCKKETPADGNLSSNQVRERNRIDLWKCGPKFLLEDEDHWPSQRLDLERTSDDIVVNNASIENTKILSDKQKLRDSLHREVITKLNLLLVRSPTVFAMKRRLSWLSLFVKWLKNKRQEQPSPPSLSDLQQAETDAIRLLK